MSASGWIRQFVAVGMAAALAACGGGPSPSAVEQSTTTKTVVLSVTLQSVGGQAGVRFREGEQFDARVVATERTRQTVDSRVISETTAPLTNTTVTLEASGSTVAPASGTALTDNQGAATFRLTAGGVAGAFAIKAKVTSGGTPTETTLEYAVDRVIQPRLSIKLTNAQGALVANARPGDEIRVALLAEKVRVNAIGVEQQLEPAGDVRIELSAENGRFDPTGSQVVTNAQGQAGALYIPGLVNGAVRVTATATIEGKVTTAVETLDVRVPQVRIGYGMPFRAGLLIDPPEIEAGASARISAQLLTEDGQSFEQPLRVEFESACVSANAATVISPVLSAGGALGTVYTAQGCTGQDRIRATVEVPGLEQPAIAEGIIRIRAPRAEGIAFVDATPPDIALRGRATPDRPDFSTVRFRVSNSAGVPVPGAQVAFSLTGQIGGATLRAASAITDNDGTASAFVQAGDSAAVVSVQATVVGTNFTTISRHVTVSTGGADQDSFSLSVETFNIEGFNIDGATTAITVRAADRFNNPVADGTRILFTTEGGAVPASCAVAAGLCTVELSSQQPRPTNGRVTVLARTEGSEAFVDMNGNGLFDAGEPFDDLGEAFVDANEDGTYTPGEFFADLNANSRWDAPNGRFDGGPCAVPSACGLAVDVRASTVVVFSTSGALIQLVPSAITVDDVTPAMINALISDRNGNLPPAGSTVEVTTSNGRILGDPNIEIGNTNTRGPLVVPIAVIGDGTASTGFLSIKITTPAGVVTNATASITDTSVCDSGVTPLPAQCNGAGNAVGSVTLTPETISVAAGATEEQNVTVRVLNSASPPGGVRGATPSVACATANGVAGESIATIQPTDANGATIVRIRATASAGASGDATCAIGVADKTATLRLAGPPAGSNVPGSMTVSPTVVTILPNDSNREVRLLTTVRNSATPAGALPAVTPAVRCSGANGVGMIVNPGIVAPTDAQGQTEVPLFLTADAAPSGSVVCEITAGTQRVEVTVRP